MQVPEWIKKVQENLARSEEKLLFADEAIVMGAVKAYKHEGKIRREGSIRIIFVDMTTLQPVAKIAVSPSTANGLVKALSTQLERMKKELEREEAEPAITEFSPTYIG